MEVSNSGLLRVGSAEASVACEACLADFQVLSRISVFFFLNLSAQGPSQIHSESISLELMFSREVLNVLNNKLQNIDQSMPSRHSVHEETGC